MSGITGYFLELMHDNQLSGEELVFPSVDDLEEITLDDFTGTKYFVDASRPFLFMMFVLPIWIIFLVMAKRSCCEWLPCAKFYYARVVTISVLVFLSLFCLILAYPGVIVLEEGLVGYTASNIVAIAAIDELIVALNAVGDLSQPIEFENETCTDLIDSLNLTDIFDDLNEALEEIDNATIESLEITDDFREGASKSATALTNSLQWVDVAFIILSMFMATTGVILAVGMCRIYKAKKKDDQAEDDACGLACFGVVYTCGVVFVSVIWVLSAILAVPTYIGADLCIGDPSLNLQDGLRRTIENETIDFCNLDNDGTLTAEEKLGNTVCYYSECRGSFFIIEEVVEDFDITPIQELEEELLETLVDPVCLDDLAFIDTLIAQVDDLLFNNSLSCVDLNPIFLEAIDDEFCDGIVAGFATVSLGWGLSSALLMVALLLGLLNPKKSVKQSLREAQRRLRKKRKRDARVRASINRGADAIPQANEYQPEAQIVQAQPYDELDDNEHTRGGLTLEDLEEEEDSFPDLTADDKGRDRGRGSSFGIRF